MLYLEAIRDIQITLGGNVSDISGPEPSVIRIQAFSCRLLVVQIALHHLRSSAAYFSDGLFSQLPASLQVNHLEGILSQCEIVWWLLGAV